MSAVPNAIARKHIQPDAVIRMGIVMMPLHLLVFQRVQRIVKNESCATVVHAMPQCWSAQPAYANRILGLSHIVATCSVTATAGHH